MVTQGPFGPSATGYNYMSGTPQIRTRRTINVDLQSPAFSPISWSNGHLPRHQRRRRHLLVEIF